MCSQIQHAPSIPPVRACHSQMVLCHIAKLLAVDELKHLSICLHCRESFKIDGVLFSQAGCCSWCWVSWCWRWLIDGWDYDAIDAVAAGRWCDNEAWISYYNERFHTQSENERLDFTRILTSWIYWWLVHAHNDVCFKSNVAAGETFMLEWYCGIGDYLSSYKCSI